ncbi:MAG: hypothetical protein WBR26_18345 [Candidatus Acidiferrum sp.]
MTQKWNHRDLSEQKAGQAVGAALLKQPLPRNTQEFTAGARNASLEEKP